MILDIVADLPMEFSERGIELPIVTYENYERNYGILSLDFIEEMQHEIQKAEEEARQRAIEEAKRIEEELERQRIESVTFDKNDVSKSSNLTGEEMYELLKDTGLSDVAYTYVQAENEYGVNAFFLAALSALESGWGNSRRATQDNNLTGYSIKSSSDYYAFSSRSESLLATAQLLGYNYLKEDGKYYTGKSVSDIHQKYCPPKDSACKGWDDKVSRLAQDLYLQYREFVILNED